jgi:hypothetical protein
MVNVGERILEACMPTVWTELLEKTGDDVEKLALSRCGLGESFPKYAEFWGKYVYEKDFGSYLTTVIYHYSILYHLVVAHEQIARVNEFPLLDVGSPYAHLATVLDLVERLFISARNMTHEPSVQQLNRVAFDEKNESYWNKEYERDLKRFQGGLGPPVAIRLHDAQSVFKKCVSTGFEEAVAELARIGEPIRRYRNTLVHDSPPLKVRLDGALYVPKLNHLAHYRSAAWNSKPSDVEVRENYVRADSTLLEHASKLERCLNSLWDGLLQLMPSVTIQGLEPELTRELVEGLNYLRYAQTGHASGVAFVDSPALPQMGDGKPKPPWLNPTRPNTKPDELYPRSEDVIPGNGDPIL